MDSDRAAFVEGFALQLAQAGMQRMAARVFATVLSSPAGGLTAREIATSLEVSAASVSGATTYLTRMGLVDRRRSPGERVDRYETQSTSWAEAMLVETSTMTTLRDWLTRGIEAAGEDAGARARLQETHDFFDFMATELPRLVERWKAERT